jgi:hypothetical protein
MSWEEQIPHGTRCGIPVLPVGGKRQTNGV